MEPWEGAVALGCNCTLVSGVCLPPNLEVPPNRYVPSSRDEVVKFPGLGLEVRSDFFKEHVKLAVYMCNVSLIVICLMSDR